MSEEESRVDSAIRTVYDDAFSEGLSAGRAGKRLSLVGISPHLFKLAFARGWVKGSTEYAAGVLKAQGEGAHARFLSATRSYLHGQESLKRLGLKWPRRA